MSNFEELCSAYKASREKFIQYRDKNYEFAGELINRYRQYLGVSTDQFIFVPLDKEPKPNSTYTLTGAIHLDEDTFWHLGLRITIFSAPNEYPQQPLVIRFQFKEDKKGYLVRISDEDPGLTVQPGNNDGFIALFDNLQNMIKRSFEFELKDFLEQTAPLKTIGFVSL